MTKINKEEASNVLSAWTALEVLSPQSFNEIEDLTNGNKNSVIYPKNWHLPWEGTRDNRKENIPKNTQLFYHIALGTINLNKSYSALHQKYSEFTPERRAVLGESIIATIITNQKGFISRKTFSTTISSFAWGVPKALEGNLKELGSWPKAEEKLLINLGILLRSYTEDKDGNKLPISEAAVEAAYEHLVNALGLSRKMINKKFFIIKTFSKSDAPQPLLLNSFYLKDLGKANALVSNDDASQALKRYLGLEVPLKRHDILKDTSVLKETISPKIIPPSCWPGPGHHPLVLLQQAAVNLSLSKLKDGDILAVNGPPGTGKTTLLRDIIAGIITKRAEAMCAFNNPDSAFSKREMEDLFYYDIDESLKGYEILIASSNNKAVENISLELPNLKAIASDCNDLRYFNAMSDKYYLYESWGIIAATLGSGSNRNKFLQTFWFDDDCSFSAYLEQAYDHRETIDIKDPNSGKIIGKRKPEIVTKNFSPHSYEDALNKWREARKEFKTALEEVNSKLTELKEVESVFKYLDSLTEDEADLQKLEERLKNNQEIRPGFFARIFRPSKVRAWKKENAALLDTKDKVIKGNEYRQKFGHYIADKKLFSKARQDIHLSSPWCNQAMQSLREKLFVAAIKVHKAFIDAAATPILHNMGKFVEHLSGAGGETLNSISAELWAQFFLVVPCASTTFASVGSMLEKVPPKSFGWLLIDEAGQATPQSAVGAIMRSRRVVVVGDPMQIEPVVTLPNSLTHGICKQFEVKAHIFNAPEASVQTLADLATSYFAEFRGKFGSRRVGVPLLVHRRCADPMFSISNAIAYERLMVNAKRPGSSLIRNYLGDSTWFDIESDSAEKWAKKEGEKLIEILIKINALEQPDLYILSPFANVAYNIREIVMKSGILYQWKIQDPKKWADTRIGTVHAAQGREAEAIIFVLGAPSKSQSGTRNWAGSKPNLLNVAATRAKEVFYVIGNQKLWRDAGVFRELADRI